MKAKECNRQLPLPYITDDKPAKSAPSQGHADAAISKDVARKHIKENRSAKPDPFPGNTAAIPSEPVTGRLLVKEVFRTMEKTFNEGSNIKSISTGNAELDRFLGGGLHCSDLITIAARPSLGKTSLVMQIARFTAIEHETPVFIFTPEMTGQELILMLLSSISNVAFQNLETGVIKEDCWAKLTAAASYISYAPVFIDDTLNISFQELREKALKIKNLNKLGLIIVDGFQFMPPVNPRQSRDDELKDLIRSFKGLAKELDVPVLLTSYLDRKVDERIDTRPTLSDLTIPGLDEFADLVLFLYRQSLPGRNKHEANPHMLSVSVAKNRHGSLGTLEIMTDDCLEDVPMHAHETQLLH